MSKWFSKQLGDGLVAYTPSTEIEEAFGPLYAAAGNPAEMAVFTRYDCAFSACKLVLPPDLPWRCVLRWRCTFARFGSCGELGNASRLERRSGQATQSGFATVPEGLRALTFADYPRRCCKSSCSQSLDMNTKAT